MGLGPFPEPEGYEGDGLESPLVTDGEPPGEEESPLVTDGEPPPGYGLISGIVSSQSDPESG